MDPMACAAAVGEGLLARGVREDGRLCWPVRQKGLRGVSPRPWDAYSGSAGVSLFLSLLGRATGDRRFSEAGEAGLARSLFLARKRRPYEAGLAGVSGLGQILLILGKVAEALRIADSLERPARDEYFELLYGSAGIGTFLLSCYRRTGDRACLRAARVRGDRLARIGAPWPFDERCSLGYSHGPAGIGEFFLRLYAQTGTRRYRDAAQACAALIARHSRRSGRGLETLYQPDAPRIAHAWCHGSPGILLFELAGAEVLGGAAWRRRARLRAQATLDFARRVREPALCYCHGLAGNLDLLLEYGWRAEALRLAESRLLPRALKDRPGLTFPCQFGPWPLPGLFLGDAGIGFFFLRLAKPDTPLFYRVL